MLDINLIRKQPDLVKARLAARGGSDADAVEQILAVDGRRRRAETDAQALLAERNRLSKEIGFKRGKGEPTADTETQVRAIGEQIALLTKQAGAADEEQRNLLLGVPNLPHPDCPVGKEAADNPVVRTWGEKPTFADGREPEDHLTVGTRLGLFDPERAAKISGSGFIVFTGLGARLERALISFLLDLQGSHGYTEVSPPFLVKRECMVGTTQLPKFEEDMYGLEGGAMFLAPTAEVPVTNLYREEILPAEALPKMLCAYTPCFRREAGSAGRETRGIIRVHQFDKVELVKITTPETSYAEHEKLTADAEKGAPGSRAALPDHRALHGRPGLRFGEDVRHRGLGSRAEDLFGSIKLLELRGLPGPPHEPALQGRRHGQEPVLPYAQRLGHGAAAAVRGVAGKLPGAGRQHPRAGAAPGLPEGQADRVTFKHMTIDPHSGRLAFQELGLTVEPSLTRSDFVRLPTGAVCLPRVRHDPSFRYQLPAVPQADSTLYVVLQFHYERLAALNLFHHAERFDGPEAGEPEAVELARKSFHEHWLAARFGVSCGHYRWGTVSSSYDPVGRSSSIVIEYAKPNTWQAVGRTAGRIWGAASNRR